MESADATINLKYSRSPYRSSGMRSLCATKDSKERTRCAGGVDLSPIIIFECNPQGLLVVVGGGGGERNTPMPHTPNIILFAALIHATIFF